MGLRTFFNGKSLLKLMEREAPAGMPAGASLERRRLW